MREIRNINSDWLFSKNNNNFDLINLPHTWNAIDGTDGKNDYYRGKCYYKKKIILKDKLNNKEVFLEFKGANHSAEVYFNGEFVGHHDGGYSTFRFRITDLLKEENELCVNVTNEINDRVYPQQADFTFYGGIYRDVNLLIVPKSHICLSYFGGNGIKVTPTLNQNMCNVLVEAYVTNGEDMDITFTLLDESVSKKVKNGYACHSFVLNNPHLWNGVEDPYLYKVLVSLKDDLVEQSFGVRKYEFDPNNGFILNDKKYLLRGVAKHQDKAQKGSAISKEDMEEDIKIILDMGATAVRLAHYQHDQYFYDLCDKVGLIVWAEIPYISEHLANGFENTLSQMKELVVQNYNHPSIVCWGLSNEICISNDENEDRYINHIKLNTLCHSLDSTRKTAMAHIGAFNCDTNKLFNIPDIHGINIYYGWYEKKVSDCKEYFDSRHLKHPNACFGITEYGADCNPKYCGLDPERGDYSENYQAYYHEQMLEIIEERPYLWGTFIWNMFDFGADGRNEGGKSGQNQKGLVTFDRKYKKDAYYLYKCHWNKDPMVHICNKNYINRVEERTKIIVYSNCSEVSLYIDDKLFETKKGKYKYEFDFKISRNHIITARAKGLKDSFEIKKVNEPDSNYKLDNKTIINWLGFIDKEKSGYFTLNSKVKDILNNEKGKEYVLKRLAPYNITYDVLTGDNPRNPGTTLELIPIKFVLRMCKNLTPEDFNSFAEGLMEIKIK